MFLFCLGVQSFFNIVHTLSVIDNGLNSKLIVTYTIFILFIVLYHTTLSDIRILSAKMY